MNLCRARRRARQTDGNRMVVRPGPAQTHVVATRLGQPVDPSAAEVSDEIQNMHAIPGIVNLRKRFFPGGRDDGVTNVCADLALPARFQFNGSGKQLTGTASFYVRVVAATGVSRKPAVLRAF